MENTRMMPYIEKISRIWWLRTTNSHIWGTRTL